MNRTELVRAILWLDNLSLQAKEERAKLAAQLTADARAEYEEQGTAPTWRIPDVATVSSSVSHSSVYVANPDLFLEWVQDRYPTEIERVRRVRSAWQEAFLDRHAIPEGDRAVDSATGELVPGLRTKVGGDLTGVSVRATAAAKDAMAAVAAHGLRQLAADVQGVVVLAELEAADAS